MAAPAPESISIAQFVLASAVVLGLMAALAFGLKLLARRNLSFGGSRRIKVVESLNIDMRRRFVIVRCDEAEHLLLLGGERDLVVVENLKSGEAGVPSVKDIQ